MKPFPEPIHVTRPILPPLDRLEKRLRDVWSSGWLTNGGPQHALLEGRLREYLDVPHFSLFNNGTIALITAVQSLRLSGEVLTTPFTFPATPHVLAWNGIRPVFCDIDPNSLNMSANRLEDMITPETSGILAVHVYGTPCDTSAIQDIANRYGLKVIYDAAHAFGERVGGEGIGNFGDITMFSFHATKLFHTGEGGGLAVKDAHTKARIDLLKNFGISGLDHVVMPGINGKMNELQAALGLEVLDCIDDERRKRGEVIRAYREVLADVPGIRLMQAFPDAESSHQYFVIRIDEDAFGMSRDRVQEELRNHNIFSRKYFYPLCSNYPCYRQLPSAAEDKLPVANRVVREVLCLPLYGDLGATAAAEIAGLIRALPQGARGQAHQ